MKKEPRKYHLKRDLGLLEVTLTGVGILVGAGIYALLGKATSLAGNAVWISFIFAAIVAAITGLSYAELSSMFPKAGAEYIYAEHAFNRRMAFVIGLLIIVSGVLGSAAVSLGFANYFSALFGTPIVPVAVSLVLLLSAVNFYGIKQSAGVAILFTLVEIVGLIIVIFIGIPYIGKINYFEFSGAGFTGVFSAAALIFFAYLGFEEMVKLAEETKNPTRNIPIALVTSISITTVIYILVAVAAVSILGWQGLSGSATPIADVAKAALGGNAFLIFSIIALFATSSTALLMMVAVSRVMYGMAIEEVLPRHFSQIHFNYKTPHYSILCIMLLTSLFVFVKKIELVADMTNFVAFLTFIMINAAVILLRYKWPGARRPFRTPIHIGAFPLLPLFGIIASAFMLANIGFWILVCGVVLLAISFLCYELFID